MTTARDVARWRLRTQRLVYPLAATASEVVTGPLAVQAENPGQSAWAVACRTAAPDASDLAGLLDAGTVVRTHVLRPTWHYVAAADVGWLLELTAPRTRPLFARQLARDHGLAGSDLARALSALGSLVGERPDLTRDDVVAGLAERGHPLPGRAVVLLLALAEADRLVCSGRGSGAGHTYALFEDRVGVPEPVDRDEALARLALRYLAGHGPATERDLAYWATLPVTDVRRGIEQVRSRLASFERDGLRMWHLADAEPPAAPQKPAAHLLQILDETYRGYQESRMVLDAGGLVIPGREAVLGMALVDGQIVGQMMRTVGRRLLLEVRAWRPLGSAEHAALEQAAARYGKFLGLDHELHVR